MTSFIIALHPSPDPDPMITAVDAANTLLITDTRLAACFRALGFRYHAETIIQERTDTPRTQFLFELHSLRFPHLNARLIYGAWKSGQLQQTEPMHLLCVMMLAQANYDAMLSMTKDRAAYRLASCAGGQLTRYEPGTEAHAITLLAERVPTDDLRLAACVGLLGIPATQITCPQSRRHVFHLAAVGYPVLLADGRQHLHRAVDLIRRAPSPTDPLRLQMEIDQPLHPLCIAYDALYNRTELKRELGAQAPLLLVDEPTHRLTGDGAARELLSARQALISSDADGRVMDHVTAHMKSPPIHWP